jgi:hypothetical protein
MRQITPQSWGRVYWGGGAGKPGEMGGWRFHCAFCDHGNVLQAIARKPLADKLLSQHVIDKHSHKTEVRALLQMYAAGFFDGEGDPITPNSTGAADGDALIVKCCSDSTCRCEPGECYCEVEV